MGCMGIQDWRAEPCTLIILWFIASSTAFFGLRKDGLSVGLRVVSVIGFGLCRLCVRKESVCVSLRPF